MAVQREQRQTPRIQPFVARCRYVSDEQRVPGFLTDLSERGGRIHAEAEPPPVGRTVAVEVRFGHQATHVRLSATVRWSRRAARGGYVFGVSFEGNGAEEQQILHGVVEEFHRRAASIL
ncbi:MAG TPA: PilZ domain-containing protein [Vicinamibacteria bacterium]|nr:PilZ domain-containing protein [Vicinamibacteria bacterium]